RRTGIWRFDRWNRARSVPLEREPFMKKILVPVCVHTGREQIEAAAREAATIYRNEESVQVHLLSVQVPLSRHVSDCFELGELREIQRAAGREALAPAKAILDAAGVPY